MSVERWRMGEMWFAPSMAGVGNAGLDEVLQIVFTSFSLADRGRLVQSVFFTGSPAQMPGLTDRLHATLPLEIPLHIVRQWTLDADMAAFAHPDELQRAAVSRAEYEEWGGERVRR